MVKIISSAQLDMRDRRSLPPKPRIGDIVERSDMSKMFGRVTGIKRPDHVIVQWPLEEGMVIELITDLALVERPLK